MAGSAPSKNATSQAAKHISAYRSGEIHLYLDEYYTPHKWGRHNNTNYFQNIESLRLDSDKSFPADVWLGLDREFVTRAIKTLPGFPQTSAIRDMILRLLISGGKTQLMSSYSRPYPGEDLLTLRLKKLNQIGAFAQSAAIYRKIKDTPYHPDLVLAGITAFLLTGEIEEACLEVWSFADQLDQSQLWSRMSFFCQNYFEPGNYPLTADKTHHPEKPESSLPTEISWKKTHSMPLALLYVLTHPHNNAPNQEQSTPLAVYLENSRAIPSPSEISLGKAKWLVEQNIILPPSLELVLSYRLYQGGVIDLGVFKKRLQNLAPDSLGSSLLYKKQINEKEYNTKNGANEFTLISDAAFHYNNFVRAGSREKRVSSLLDMIRIAQNNKIGLHILHPLLDLLNPDLLNELSHKKRQHILISYTSSPSLPRWLENYVTQVKENNESPPSELLKYKFIEKTYSLSSSPFLSLEKKKNSSPQAVMVRGSIKSEDNGSKDMIFINVSELIVKILLDIKGNISHIPYQAYEKHMGLTRYLNYVIKSFKVKKQMHSAAIQNSKAQLSLINLMIIGNSELHNLEDGVLYLVVKTFTKVRLTDLAYNIYLNALSGFRLIKKEY